MKHTWTICVNPRNLWVRDFGCVLRGITQPEEQALRIDRSPFRSTLIPSLLSLR